MKTLLIHFINFYQLIFSPLLKLILGTPAFCKYSPSCSAYTKHAIKERGVVLGIIIGAKRLLTCI